MPSRREYVPAKKTRKTADGARYLLSADRKFRRLSLKKISERVKSARRRTTARSSAKTASASQSLVPSVSEAASANAPVALVLGGAVLFAAVVGILWSSPSPSATENAAVLSADVASEPAVPAKVLLTTPTPEAPRALEAPAPAPRALEASPAPAAVTAKPASRPADQVKVRTEIVPLPAFTSPASTSTPVEAKPIAAAPSVDTVTISGCLEHDGKSAWLKDASGIDAPRTRSWKSGFLKKRSPRIALVDGPSSASAYDGHQVSVTGVLVDREMHVSSLKSIAGDCE
jgi:hypothetical protein